MKKAVFLDKDGTLIVDVPYNVDPARIQLYPDASPALKRLQRAGYRLLVISNQSGVARGYFPETALNPVWQNLSAQLGRSGVTIDGFYYCPHHPHGSVEHYAVDCTCRKPAPGLLKQAAASYGLDLSQCWMVGDILNDVEAGSLAGCRTILVDRGNETEWLTGPHRIPTTTVQSLTAAADYIQNADESALSDTDRRQVNQV
ncbi:histidinol-phosphate phosphatase family protein [Spirosoma lacussanchae]|uniref:D-glycero-alpha-D-manno-heptose-1,7-bisphosphate 7-phosphatase n=1 Tax=Spirosoma lacussanchae TaxID=1884249 RepID=UPI001108475C|nr:HAD family hydrolase [Spirosoma lacussanchae]